MPAVRDRSVSSSGLDLQERVVEIKLLPEEQAAFDKSCGAVRELIEACKKLIG